MLTRHLWILLALTGCGNHQTTSDVKGHFENETSAHLAQYKGQQQAIAEYEPVKEVIVSYKLLSSYGREDIIVESLKAGVEKIYMSVPSTYTGDLSHPVFDRLRQLLGQASDRIQLVPNKASGDLTVWARDWAPLAARGSGNEPILIDTNYYPNRPSDDSSPQALGALQDWQRISLPVYTEGGNYMSDSRGNCFFSSWIVEENQRRYVGGDIILNADEIKGIFNNYAGCSSSTIFPRLPYEGTGHIDMWAKVLNDSTVMVSDLLDATIDLYTSSSDVSRARTVQTFLNDRSDDFRAMGYNVVRVPMPAPNFSSGVVRSYTNSLFVNGTALIPQYISAISSFGGRSQYIDNDYLDDYERLVLEAYANAGFKNVFIDSDELIHTGGAVHCVTMQLGR